MHNFVKERTDHEFDGDHFFIQPFKAEIAETIQDTLTPHD
jgi:surfactin synthase thioesterase subunit